MKKYILLLKKNIFLYKKYILVVLIISSTIIYFLTRPSQPSYQNKITPGKTTIDELYKDLGQPTSKADWKSFQILNYQGNTKWEDKVFLQNNQISLIIQIIPRETSQKSTDFINKYGDPPLTMYGLLSPTFNLYAYPRLGFAMVANPDQKILYQLWYFPPTNQTEFINTLATPNEYSLEAPTDLH